MLRILKAGARAVLPNPVFHALKGIQRSVVFSRAHGFSEEEQIIDKFLAALPLGNHFCVDIAAQDGVSGSQALALFKKGWKGIAVECAPDMFAILADKYKSLPAVALFRGKVVPENIVNLLSAAICPRDFAFLNLDIDSYDHFILDHILSSFRPLLICVEINEAIPPPLKFTVKYVPDLKWEEGTHFQGQSISKCHELCIKYDYDIVDLYYNNMFLIPHEVNRGDALSPQAAYDRGYRNKPDRKTKFPWNADVEELLHVPVEEAFVILNRRFAKFDGQYILNHDINGTTRE